MRFLKCFLFALLFLALAFGIPLAFAFLGFYLGGHPGIIMGLGVGISLCVAIADWHLNR